MEIAHQQLIKKKEKWAEQLEKSRKAAENFVKGSGWMPSGLIFDGNFIDQTQAVIEPPPQPQPYDAVLGGQAPQTDRAINP